MNENAGGFHLLNLPGLSFFFRVLSVGLPSGFLFRKLAWSFPNETELRAFCGDVSKGSEVFGGLRRGGPRGGGKSEIFVWALFFISSTQWSFQRTSLKRHSYSLCVKGVSAGRVCWCRQAGWWLTKVIRLWNLAGEWGGVSSAPSRRAPQGQARLEAPRLLSPLTPPRLLLLLLLLGGSAVCRLCL